MAIFSTVLALAAIYISWRLYGRKPLAAGEVDPLKARLGFVFKGMENKWWVDELYDAIIVQPFRRLAAFLADVVDWRFWHDWVHDSLIARGFRGFAHFLAEPVDLGVIDGISRALAALAKGLARGLSLLQSGYVRNYALMVFFGVVLMIGYLVFSS